MIFLELRASFFANIGGALDSENDRRSGIRDLTKKQPKAPPVWSFSEMSVAGGALQIKRCTTNKALHYK